MVTLRLDLGFSLALLGALVAGCGGGDDDDGGMDASEDATVSPACLEAETYQDYASIRDNILRPSCGNFSSCHSGTRAKEGLNLDPEERTNSSGTVTQMADPMRPYVELMGADGMGVQSEQVPSLKLIEPGDPENSYLMIKLGRYDQTKRVDDLMPLEQNDIFCAQKVDAIERWIAAGATAE